MAAGETLPLFLCPNLIKVMLVSSVAFSRKGTAGIIRRRSPKPEFFGQ
jgi:hypothetical protein